MNEKDLKVLIFLGALLFVGLSAPVVQEYLKQLFNAILSAVFLGVLILIVGGAIWFFFFRDRWD
jgi:hypothetical protein